MSALTYPWLDLVESQPWRSADRAEWNRREELRLLGEGGTRMMTSRDKQDLSMHSLHLMDQPCWLCGEQVTYYLAMGRADVEYSERQFSCPCCGVELEHVVPLMAFPRPWYWGRPKDIDPMRVIMACSQWSEARRNNGQEVM